MELFKNFASTVLDGGIDNSQTSITVTNGSALPAISVAGDWFRIRIDDECMLVTARSGNTLTVARASDGSTAATHANTARVDQPLTAGSLQQFRIDGRQARDWDDWTARKAGRLMLGRTLHHSMGVDWGTKLEGKGDLFGPLKPFSTSGWSGISGNVGGTVWNTTRGYFYLESPASTSDNHRGLEKAIPSTPFKWRVCAYPLFFPANYISCGIGFYESTSGKAETIHFVHSTNGLVEMNKWSSRTSYNSTRAAVDTKLASTVNNWLQIGHDGTNLTYEVSFNGRDYYMLANVAKNNWFSTGPTHLQIHINAVHPTWGGAITILHSEFL